MAFTASIDPPPRWAPAEAWRRFLSDIERLPQDDHRVRFARELAKQQLAQAESRSRKSRRD
ncbi:MAG TPA: hypothetical protein VE131_11930 [Terriglobales bacterium]|nr:hypothetical protein [Terriglobales bacterium]